MIIRYQKFNFTIEATEPIGLPYYKGSTFRGGFGNAFKRVVCALKRNDCSECLLKTRCVYAYIFETPPLTPTLFKGDEVGESPKDTGFMGMNKYETVPHPFIIEPPDEGDRVFRPGDKILFSLILVGRSIEYLPYFIYTFEELGSLGIGKGRGRYRLLKVDNGVDIVYSFEDKALRIAGVKELHIPEDFDFDIDSGKSITVRFITPARIMYQRALTVDLQFHVLIRSLLRRLCLLHYFHCESREPSWDHKQIIQEGEKITIDKSSLQWWDWERYSSRQGTRMKMGGVVGEVTYKGSVEQFLPILRAGEIVHVGKGTSFGLGKYGIVRDVSAL